MKAARQLARLQVQRANVLRAFGDATDGAITPEMLRAVPAATKKPLAAVIRGIRKTAPGTETAATAVTLAAEFGIELPATP